MKSRRREEARQSLEMTKEEEATSFTETDSTSNFFPPLRNVSLSLCQVSLMCNWRRLVKLAGYLIFVSECESGSERSRDKLVKVLAVDTATPSDRANLQENRFSKRIEVDP
ncbi:hypothetical protein F2Q69_00053026 [Brassica cretica]|uniref:Uncharacterized protein n=1 Tax=Brassica cretica TaxID=69181 RepID=A0A8S9MYP3_BRACR|nr:hypothetical protein F2Q69_00053026 [Brassica cretica]